MVVSSPQSTSDISNASNILFGLTWKFRFDALSTSDKQKLENATGIPKALIQESSNLVTDIHKDATHNRTGAPSTLEMQAFFPSSSGDTGFITFRSTEKSDLESVVWGWAKSGGIEVTVPMVPASGYASEHYTYKFLLKNGSAQLLSLE